MRIVPSILEKNPRDLFFQISRLSKYFSYLHIDIADGRLVPNKTVQVEDIVDFFESNQYKKIITLQTLKNILFDFHLMTKNNEAEIRKIEKLKKMIKINLIFIHPSVTSFHQWQSPLFPIGLTLDPDDQVNDLANHYNLKKIPAVQIMSVVPGVQGNPFLPDTLKKIEQLRLLGYRNNIFLDGAVNKESIPIINNLKYKPDIIGPGSFLTKTKTLKKNVEYLNKYV